jgi:hypothetical protein
MAKSVTTTVRAPHFGQSRSSSIVNHDMTCSRSITASKLVLALTLAVDAAVRDLARVLAIDIDIDEELVDRGINAVFTFEPMGS